MKKRNVRLVNFSKDEMAYDIPSEIDLKRLRREGRGAQTVHRLLERSNRTIVLEPDVYEEFRTAKDVNETLRLVQKLRRAGEPPRRKRSA